MRLMMWSASNAMGHLTDGDAARLELQLDGPQRPEQRNLGGRDGSCAGCSVPCCSAHPRTEEIAPVKMADAVVVFLGARFAFATAVVQDLARTVAGQALMVVMG